MQVFYITRYSQILPGVTWTPGCERVTLFFALYRVTKQLVQNLLLTYIDLEFNFNINVNGRFCTSSLVTL